MSPEARLLAAGGRLPKIQGGGVIEPAPVVGRVLPVKVTVPDFGGQLWAEDCYATTEDGRRVAPMDPEAAVIAAGAEPLAKAIVDEADSTASRDGRRDQSQTVRCVRTAGGFFRPEGLFCDLQPSIDHTPAILACLRPYPQLASRCRMPAIDWQVAAAVATVVSTVAFAASAIVVVLQLRQAARERYFSVTAHLFEIWQSPEFQHDQLFLLHKLPDTTWETFCAGGRGENCERALHRVGGYYDRVGNLVRHNLIHKQDILPTIGGYAVAVWHQIEPLVKELRLRENAVLFQNYEALLPECHECYAPGIATSKVQRVIAAENGAPAPACAIESRIPFEAPPPPRVEPVAQRFSIDQSKDTGRAIEMTAQNTTVNGHSAAAGANLTLPDSDGIPHSLSEYTSSGLAVLVYARGAWCPFCLRQLADYAERYGDFKRLGIEVVAVSPESQRKSRRMRTGLKLPFTVLSDAKLEAAKMFGLMDHEKPGAPTPATLVLDSQQSVRMSTLNQWESCVLARDTLQYARTLKETGVNATLAPPPVAKPQPGWLFARGIANMVAGLISG